jgi:hypothetical protein
VLRRVQAWNSGLRRQWAVARAARRLLVGISAGIACVHSLECIATAFETAEPSTMTRRARCRQLADRTV